MKKRNSYEGLQENIRELKTLRIDTFKNKYPDKEYTVHLETQEFTCICPKTGLPDFGGIVIHYIPDKLCAELRSFKLYLHSFRSIGIFHEHLANKVLDDFVSCCRPRRAHITVTFNIRGGIRTTVSREYEKN